MISIFKKEIHKAKAEACREYGFNSIPSSKLYETSLDLKKKIRYLSEYYIDYQKKDQGERACSIWTFWKNKIIDDSEFIFYHNDI